MEAVLSRLRGLTADELREEFARADLRCGPITATTRATFERKLARVLAGPESSSTELEDSGGTNSSPNHAKPTSCTTSAVAATTSASISSSSGGGSTEAAGEEIDFGYGVGLNPPEEEEIPVKTTSNSSAERSNSQSKAETPSKTAQVSPTFYGVCPLWEDVLTRTGKSDSAHHDDVRTQNRVTASNLVQGETLVYACLVSNLISPSAEGSCVLCTA